MRPIRYALVIGVALSFSLFSLVGGTPSPANKTSQHARHVTSTSSPAATAGGFWGELLESLEKKTGELASTIILGLAAFAGLLVLGRFTRLPEQFKKTIEWTNADLWIYRIAGRYYLWRARRSRDSGDATKGLANFNRGIGVLERARTDATQRGVDAARIQSLLTTGDLAEFYGLRAWNDVLNGRLDDGIGYAQQAWQLDPELVVARIARGWGKLRRNKGSDVAESESDFLAAIEVGLQREIRFLNASFGYAEVLRLRGEYAKAIEELSDLLRYNFQPEDVLASRGCCHHALGGWKEAVVDLTAALEIDPNHKWARLYRADALSSSGLLEEAVEDCRAIIRRESADAEAYYIYGFALYRQSQSEPVSATKRKLLVEAEKQLGIARDIAISRQRPMADIYYRLAAVESDLGNKAESQRWLSQARRSATTSAAQTRSGVPDLFALGPSVRDLLIRPREGDIEITLREALELVRTTPDSANAHYCAGLLYLVHAESTADPGQRADTIAEAIDQFQRTIQLSSQWPEAYYASALSYMWRGDPARALEDCSHAISLAPESPDAYSLRAYIRNAIDPRDQATDDVTTALRLVDAAIDGEEQTAGRHVLRAELCLRRGDTAAAVEAAQTARTLDSCSAAASLVLGFALVRLEKFQDALLALDRAIRLNPTNADSYLARGVCLYRTGHEQDALEAFAKVLELKPAESAAYLHRGWTHLQIWEKNRDPLAQRLAMSDLTAATADPRSAAVAYAAQAWLHYREHRESAATLDAALRCSRLALDRDEQLGFAHYVRGWLATEKGSLEEAKAAFSRSIDAGYDVADAYYGLANAELRIGNLDSAIEISTKAIDRARAATAPGWTLFHGRALAHAANQNWERAHEDYRAAVESARASFITPTQYAGLQADFGWTCFQLGRDDEMEQSFQSGLDLDPELSHLHAQIGIVRLYCGRYDAARDEFTRTIELDPQSSSGYVNRGLTEVYRGNLPAAMRDLDLAVEMNGNDPFAWHTRGWARLRHEVREYGKAVADIDKALALSSDDPFRFNDRALARWWLSNRDGTIEDLRKVLEGKLPKAATERLKRVREDTVTWGATAQDWSGAVAHRPKDSLVHLGRGVSRYLAGDLAGAREDLARTRALHRRSPEARDLLDRIEAELSAAASA